MNELMQQWLASHPEATPAEAYRAGYLQAVDVYIKALSRQRIKDESITE